MAIRTYGDSWASGFEDAIEIAYSIVTHSKDLAGAKSKLEEYLGMVKEKKFTRIIMDLGVIDHSRS
jgi:hypothetical protein